MKFRVTLSLLLLCLCIQVNAQQRKRTTSQHRVSTAVRKPTQSAITKTRQVGSDGFVWYRLKKGGLYGAADIEGRTIIPIKYTGVFYIVLCEKDLPYFIVEYDDFEGLYTRTGYCVIPVDKHYTSVYLGSSKNEKGKFFWGVKCMNSNEQYAFYDIRGNEVIPAGDYEDLSFSYMEPVMAIKYKKNGLEGLFDLNGNKLTEACANSFTHVYDDKIKIVNKVGDQYKDKYIYGTYSEETRFDYNNFDRFYYPFKSSSNSNSSSILSPSSSSSSSSNSGSHQQRQVWKERWRPCTTCDPNRKGYCRYCQGQGGSYIGNIYNVCGICGGTGSCTMCGGRGEVKETYSTWE